MTETPHIHDEGKPMDILAHLQDEHDVDDVSFEEADARHNELHDLAPEEV